MDKLNNNFKLGLCCNFFLFYSQGMFTPWTTVGTIVETTFIQLIGCLPFGR